MLISKQLRVALIISFFWHLFWISSICIIFLPNSLPKRQFPLVNFIGSVLRNNIADNQSLTRPAALVSLPAEADIHRQGFFKISPDVFLQLEKKYFRSSRFIDVDKSERKKAIFKNVSSSSPVKTKDREILFRPAFHQYPEWNTQQISRNDIVFKIYISAEGLVQQVINLRTCGNPEIDAALARYIRRWRFAPDADQRAQWQKIKLSLEAL